MLTTTAVGTADQPPTDRGTRLAAHCARKDQEEAGWLVDLAGFDDDGEWAADGQVSAANWLMWRGRMGRATAFDKLRVAHQVADRPALAEALASGRVSYSAVRAITRATHTLPETDRALLDLAEHGTIADVETAVRAYRALADQHRPPPDPEERRSVTINAATAGVADGRVILAEAEMDEFAAILSEFETALWWAEHPDGTKADPEAPDRPARLRRADAFMSLLRTAIAGLRGGRAPDPDGPAERFTVNYVRIEGSDTVTRPDGREVDPVQASVVECDATKVDHAVTPDGEPLSVGRARRDWTRPQRRAALLRDGGRCRFPGCAVSFIDLHHQRWWSKGGDTDLDNAISLCRHHHRLQHTGFGVTGTPNGELTFLRPDGTPIGSTRPRRPEQPRAA